VRAFCTAPGLPLCIACLPESAGINKPQLRVAKLLADLSFRREADRACRGHCLGGCPVSDRGSPRTARGGVEGDHRRVGLPFTKCFFGIMIAVGRPGGASQASTISTPARSRAIRSSNHPMPKRLRR
jgi:hypothetical protein